MDRNQSKPFEDFFFSFLAFSLAVGGSIYYMFPAVERRFQDQPPFVAPVAITPEAKPAASPEKPQVAPAVTAKADNKIPKPRTTARSKSPTDRTVSKGALGDAMRLIDAGQWQQAEPVLAELLKAEPRNSEALIEMAMLNLLDKRDNDQALPFVKRALEVDSENEPLISELLTIYDEKGQAPEALEFLRKLSAAQPESKAVEYGMAQALLRNGQRAEAVEYLQKSIENREGWDKDDALEQLGDTYADLGMTDQAMESWREVIERQKAHTEAQPEDKDYLKEKNNGLRIKLAAQLMELGRYEEAETMLKELERESPGDEYIASLRKNLKQRKN